MERVLRRTIVSTFYEHARDMYFVLECCNTSVRIWCSHAQPSSVAIEHTWTILDGIRRFNVHRIDAAFDAEGVLWIPKDIARGKSEEEFCLRVQMKHGTAISIERTSVRSDAA